MIENSFFALGAIDSVIKVIEIPVDMPSITREEVALNQVLTWFIIVWSTLKLSHIKTSAFFYLIILGNWSKALTGSIFL